MTGYPLPVLGFALVSAALMGCGSASEQPPFAVRDSAGIRIVENRVEAPDTGGWMVDHRPELEIGEVEGPPEYQLNQVRGAVRFPDGTVVVANGGTNDLRWYQADGRFTQRVGGGGGGPGEFISLDAVASYRGDSLAAWDGRQRRLSVFGGDGSFGRSATLPDLTSVSATLRAVLPDGSVVLQPTGTSEDYLRMKSGERRDTATYLRFAADGRLAGKIARRAGREYLAVRAGPVISQRNLLFGRDSYVATAQERVFVGESDRFVIDILDFGGGMLASIRRAGELRPVPPGDLARARDAARQAANRNREQAARMAGVALPGADAEVPARSTVPAFDRLLGDSEGYLWVRDFLAAPGDVPRWSVFDMEGRWVATVRTPAGVEVYQIGPDWLLGRGRDELEVEYVRLYRLHRG